MSESSTFQELLITISITNLCLLVYNTLRHKALLFDFVIWILPQYCVIMYPDHKWELIACACSLINYADLKFTKFLEILRTRDAVLDVNDYRLNKLNRNIVTFVRSIIALQVAICILGVDFKSVFPKRFVKLPLHGYGLMDVGVGSYLFNSGILGRKQNMSNILILFLLGVIRFFTIKTFGLVVDPREYGVHSNFFFILALVRILYMLLPFNHLGYILLSGYTLLMKILDVDKFVLNDIRLGFLQENKESIYVLIPFLCFMMMTKSIEDVLFHPYSKNKKVYPIRQNLKTTKSTIKAFLKHKVKSLSKWSFIFYVFFQMCLYIELPCRRLGNMTYIFFILFTHTFISLTYVFVSILTTFSEYKTMVVSSRLMTFNFLFTNLLVLFLKQICNFKSHCNLIMMGYLMLSFTIPALLYNK